MTSAVIHDSLHGIDPARECPCVGLKDSVVRGEHRETIATCGREYVSNLPDKSGDHVNERPSAYLNAGTLFSGCIFSRRAVQTR